MMRQVAARIVVFFVITLLLLVSACSTKPIRDEDGTSPTVIETTLLSMSAAPEPTSRPTATPTPTPTARPEPDSLEDYFYQEGFLLKDVSAKDTEGKDVLLKSGCLICIFCREENSIDATSRFFLTDYPLGSRSDISEDEVFFEVSENRLGAACFSGIPEHELFGNEESVKSGKRTVIEVAPGTQVKQLSETERYVMRIDWDQDGYEDEVAFEDIVGRYSAEVMCYFRSGKDGSSIRVRITPDLKNENDDYPVFTVTLLLTQMSDGGYVVLLCDDLTTYQPWGMSPKTWAVSYGTGDVFVKKDLSGLFEYQDGVLYLGSEGRFFAWYTKTRTTVRLNNDLSCTNLSDTHYFLNYGDPMKYLLVDMQVQIQEDNGYVAETLPAGTYIIPDRMEISSSGESFFYFSLLDGRRAKLQVDDSQDTQYFDGKSYNEVFYFMTCG